MVSGSCSSGAKESHGVVPPSKRLQQLVSVEHPSCPITVYTDGDNSLKKLRRGLSEEDKEILDRLEKLQNDRKKSLGLPSDAELEHRLAKLKREPKGDGDEDEDDEQMEESGKSKSSAAAFYVRPDARSDQGKADDLMKLMRREVNLDDRVGKTGSVADAAEDIATRLAKLRGVPVESLKSDGVPDCANEFSDNEEEEANRVLEQIMDEQRLEEAGGGAETSSKRQVPDLGMKPLVRQVTRELHDHDDAADADHSELPWCVICNEDASLRCVDCDGDLYCRRCFAECHSEFDMKHTSTPFQKASKAAN